MVQLNWHSNCIRSVVLAILRPVIVPTPLLSTLHRSLIAFSALALGLGPRAQVLAQHRVTEADLHYHQADWERLLVLRAAEGNSVKRVGQQFLES